MLGAGYHEQAVGLPLRPQARSEALADGLAQRGVTLGQAVLQGGNRVLFQDGLGKGADSLYRKGLCCRIARGEGDNALALACLENLPDDGRLQTRDAVRKGILHGQ
ncbi:hypothetical protein D3C81_1997960 [compost metagenome]